MCIMSKCIEWTGTIGADGYGKKWNAIRNTWDQAHRVVYAEHNGDIPKGMLVRHLCHNRKCVNPEHLAIGTMKDNRQDDIDVGKDWFVGVNNNKAKLTEDQVRDIRSRTYKYGDVKKVCKEFGISRWTLHDIIKRKLWKHI